MSVTSRPNGSWRSSGRSPVSRGRSNSFALCRKRFSTGVTGGELLLFELDQFDRLLARAFDHHRTGVAEPVRAVEEFDALAFQLVDPRVEVADAEPDMVLELAQRARQWFIALVGV